MLSFWTEGIGPEVFQFIEFESHPAIKSTGKTLKREELTEII